jgi:hypothetical protein
VPAGVKAERSTSLSSWVGPVSERFPWIPLQHGLFSPGVQWHSRGERRTPQECCSPEMPLADSGCTIGYPELTDDMCR